MTCGLIRKHHAGQRQPFHLQTPHQLIDACFLLRARKTNAQRKKENLMQHTGLHPNLPVRVMPDVYDKKLRYPPSPPRAVENPPCRTQATRIHHAGQESQRPLGMHGFWTGFARYGIPQGLGVKFWSSDFRVAMSFLTRRGQNTISKSLCQSERYPFQIGLQACIHTFKVGG